MSYKIGDIVEYTLQFFEKDKGYFIGYPHYSDEVIVIAGEEALGMPINIRHCTKVGEDPDKGKLFRERLDKIAPGYLKT
jgi:hypothetical protein